MAEKEEKKPRKKYPRGPSKNPNRAHKPGVRAVPLALTPEMVCEVRELVKEGLPLSVIRGKYAFSEETWYSWFRRGREELQAYRDGLLPEEKLTLKARLVLAVGEAESECFRELLKFKSRDSFKYLEKRFGKHFEQNKEIDQETQVEKTTSNDDLINSILAFLPKPNVPGGSETK